MSTNLSKATPRPWRLSMPDDTMICGSDEDVATTIGDYSIAEVAERMEANAALIVAAVNAYDPAALCAERDEAPRDPIVTEAALRLAISTLRFAYWRLDRMTMTNETAGWQKTEIMARINEALPVGDAALGESPASEGLPSPADEWSCGVCGATSPCSMCAKAGQRGI